MSERLWLGFQDIVRRLSAAGVPRPSAAWMHEVERFYLHPTAKEWIACVGRGAGKNLVGLICDITEIVYGEWDIPPGERHFQVHVAENVTEATKTLTQCTRYLEILDIPIASATKDSIELGGELGNLGVKILACRIGAVSGWRATGSTKQETAKWNDEGTDPASEIVSSIGAMSITHPSARHRSFSSPMATHGFWYDALEQGDTEDQIVTRGASWEFNPTITEEITRKKERDERKWRREYAAIPQPAQLAAFDADAIDRAFQPKPPGTRCECVTVIDPSSGRKDSWTWGRAGWVDLGEGNRYLRLDFVWAVEGSFWQTLDGSEIVARIAADAKHYGVRAVHSDQREALMLDSAFRAHGLRYRVHDWTSSSKPLAIERVRRWLRDGTIMLPEHPKLRAELLRFEERINAAGSFTYGARGGGHDDFVALLITLAMADLAGELPGSPLHGPTASLADFEAFKKIAPRTQWGSTAAARGSAISVAAIAGVTQNYGTHSFTDLTPQVNIGRRRGGW